MSSLATDSSRGTEMAETSETRRPEPLAIHTQIPSLGSTVTNELLFLDSPMGAILSSALLHKGHAGMSLALASDILALLPLVKSAAGDRCRAKTVAYQGACLGTSGGSRKMDKCGDGNDSDVYRRWKKTNH
jgi:hypothetical protein